MTLVLTELSGFGIAMAADSAITTENLLTRATTISARRARKLMHVPHLNAGIACWGLGTVNGVDTDDWLADFIASHTNLTTLHEFAGRLAAELNAALPPNPAGELRIGCHLAGFETWEATPTPSFYHVHDGESTVLAARGAPVDPTRVNANHDRRPQDFIPHAAWLTRNGDYQLYAQIFQHLEALFAAIAQDGILIPNTTSVRDRADYLVFQIRSVSELYRLSMILPGIGGPIHYLALVPGNADQGIR